MLAQSSDAALWLLICAGPVALWVIWTDLRFMRIPNKAVFGLVLIYAVVGFLTLPTSVWAWSWLHLVVVLIIGFLLNLTGGFGAGDAKFAAAMAPYVALADLQFFLLLLAATVLAAFATHRLVRRIGALRRATPEWTSWTRAEFPMGTALGPALIFYLALAVIHGS